MNFPPLSASHRSSTNGPSSAPSPSPYTARIPRPPSGSSTYQQMLTSYGGGGGGASSVKSAGRANSSARRSGTAQSSRSRKNTQHSYDGTAIHSIEGGESPVAVAAAPAAGYSPRGGSASASLRNYRQQRSAKSAGGPSSASRPIGGYVPQMPAGSSSGGLASPRSLITTRVIDIDAATAPITAASSYLHLLRRPGNDYQSSLQFQSDPSALSAYSTGVGFARALAGEVDAPAGPDGMASGDGRRSLNTSPMRAGGGGVGSGATPPSSPTKDLGGGAGVGGLGSSTTNTHLTGNSPLRKPRKNADEAAAESGTLFRPSGRNCVRAALSGRDCDAVEVAYSVFGPALANLSTAQTLNTLERECHVAQNEERYIDAQICHDLLNQVAHNCADRAQRVVQDKVKKLQPVQVKHEENREELIQFTKLWEKELAAYDAKGEHAMVALKMKHQRLLHEKAQLLESQLAATKPHFTRRVIDLRIELGKLVALKQFREADCISKELVSLERREQERFEQTLNKKYRKSMKVVVDAHQLEHESLKGRIAAGREELLGQRRQDYQTLIQRHAIRVADVDHKVRTQLQQEHKHLQRQAVLMARRPANAVDMFSEYEQRRRAQQGGM